MRPANATTQIPGSTPERDQLTVERALRWALARLGESESSALDAQILLAHVLGRERAWVLAHGEHGLGSQEGEEYQALVARRAYGEPVAYLRGWVHWRDLELRVTPAVLIPRPETEQLVDEVVALSARRPIHRLADIGSGSGAVGIALARALPEVRVDAVDVSESALAIARENGQRHGVEQRVSLFHGHLIDPLRTEPDILVANLPYLSGEQMNELPRDVRYEPPQALYGGESGLDVYRDLVAALGRRQWQPAIVVEIDPAQEQAVKRLFTDEWPRAESKIVPDLSGRPRIAICLPRHWADLGR